MWVAYPNGRKCSDEYAVPGGASLSKSDFFGRSARGGIRGQRIECVCLPIRTTKQSRQSGRTNKPLIGQPKDGTWNRARSISIS